MAQVSTRGAFRWSLALAWGFLVMLVTANWAGADDAVPRVAVRVQGAWLNYRDDNPVHTGEGAVDSRLDFGSATGVEVGVELRPWRLLGIEIATAYVPFGVRETDFIHHYTEPIVEKSRSRFHFRSLSVGLDFHIPAGKRVDIYLGPTHGRLIYGGRNHFGEGDDLDPHDAFGAVVGVDVKPGTGPFAFTASVRYFRSPLSGQLVGPQTYIDVYLVGAGLSCRF